MLAKQHGDDAPSSDERKYRPSEYTGSKKMPISGKPNLGEVSTSIAERNSLTMRMSMRQFTRLTNVFSKKVENLEAAVAFHFIYYDFARIHQILRVTPAMEAGIADHPWTIEEIAGLLDKK